MLANLKITLRILGIKKIKHMDKFDRIQQLHRIFSSRRTPVPLSTLAESLECSEKTAQRAIDTLRDHTHAPLEYDRELKGWYYNLKGNDKFELPGLWLTAAEIQGLAMVMAISKSMDLMLFEEETDVIRESVESLLRSRKVEPDAFAEKVHFLPRNRLPNAARTFQKITEALLQNKRLQLSYGDYHDRKTQREVSPLKLVQYQDNWYLDAWCHLRQELRQFMLARIDRVERLNATAKEIDLDQQQAFYASSYGIFTGSPKHTAKLKFEGAAAREAASYQWHPKQTSEWQGKDYLLTIPYNDDRELIRTLLGFGNQLTVLAPATLKKKLLTKAKQIVTNYDPGWGGGKF